MTVARLAAVVGDPPMRALRATLAHATRRGVHVADQGGDLRCGRDPGRLWRVVCRLDAVGVWRDRKPIKPVTIRMHILQINDALRAVKWRIVSLDNRYVLAHIVGAGDVA